MLLVWECAFLFLIRNTDWYAENADTLDTIDNYVVLFSIIHFLIFIELYSKLQVIYFFCIFLLVQLEIAYYLIPESIYYFLYLLIISYPIIRTFLI